MKQIFDSLWKSKLAIPLVVAIVASSTLLAVSHYKIGQTASVVAGSCYFQSEIDKMVADKTSLESEVSTLTADMDQINTDLSSNSESITKNQSQIDDLNTTLISDYTLEQKKGMVDKVYEELNARKDLDSQKIEYQAKSKDLSANIDGQKKIVTVINTASTTAQAYSAQILAKQSLLDQEKYFADTQATLAKLLLQISDDKVLDTKYTASHPTVAPTGRGAVADFNTAVAAYNTELAKYKSKYTDYITPTLQPATYLTNVYNTLKATYDTKYASYTTAVKAYNAKYLQEAQFTIDTLKNKLYIYVNQYNNQNSLYAEFTGIIARLTGELSTLKDKFALAVKDYQTTYKYSGTIPEVADIQSKYDAIAAKYTELVAKNSEIKTNIEKLNAEIGELNAKTTELNSRYASDQSDIDTKNSKIADLANAISNAQNNICPTIETSCSNGVDDDRDGVQDCDDIDCSTAPECQTTDITNVTDNTVVDTTTNTIDTAVTTNNDVAVNTNSTDNNGIIDGVAVDWTTNAANTDQNVGGGMGNWFRKLITKKENEVCCTCAYDDYSDAEGSDPTQKSCEFRLKENGCTIRNLVHVSGESELVSAAKNFPNQCPKSEYDNVKFMFVQHGDGDGRESLICKDIPNALLDGYTIKGEGAPDKLGVISGGCNDFNNYSDPNESIAYGEELKNKLIADGYQNVEVTIKASQTNIITKDSKKFNEMFDFGKIKRELTSDGYSEEDAVIFNELKKIGALPDGATLSESCGTINVCWRGVKKELDSCPPVGSSCPYDPTDTSNTTQCSENGQTVIRKCEQVKELIGLWR